MTSISSGNHINQSTGFSIRVSYFGPKQCPKNDQPDPKIFSISCSAGNGWIYKYSWAKKGLDRIFGRETGMKQNQVPTIDLASGLLLLGLATVWGGSSFLRK